MLMTMEQITIHGELDNNIILSKRRGINAKQYLSDFGLAIKQ